MNEFCFMVNKNIMFSFLNLLKDNRLELENRKKCFTLGGFRKVICLYTMKYHKYGSCIVLCDSACKYCLWSKIIIF